MRAYQSEPDHLVRIGLIRTATDLVMRDPEYKRRGVPMNDCRRLAKRAVDAALRASKGQRDE